MLPQVLSDTVGCVETIHNWHAAIHENYAIGAIVMFVGLFDLLESYLTIRSLINEIIDDLSEIRMAYLLDNDTQSQDIVGLIIDNENLP